MNSEPKGLWYTGCRLDRAGASRKDSRWVGESLDRPDTRFVPVWRSRNLVAGLEIDPAAPRAIVIRRTYAENLLAHGGEPVFLGLEDDSAVFAVDLSSHDEGALTELASEGEFLDLRRAGPWLHPQDAALLAYARGIVHWHQTHRYCGRCGNPTESREGGHLRVCTNSDCGRETYPRIDPAVIMLVEQVPADNGPRRCLLARHSRLPARVYTTLAGFVEPGESLEEAVRREVMEEVGVRVESVIYQGSQPWPFPSQMMLGFRAVTHDRRLAPDEDEIVDARWFTVDEVLAAGDWGDDAAAVQLPRRDSIARYLIDSWVAAAAAG